MKSRPLSLLLAALLTGCSLYTPLPPSSAVVSVVGSASASVRLPFTGSWEVNEDTLPTWLQVSPMRGRGDIALSLTAAGANGCAAQSGQVRLDWTRDLAGPGSTTLTVNYTPSSSTASVGTLSVTPSGADDADDLGVVVTYRSPGAAQKARARGGSGSSTSRQVLVRGQTLEQARADPEVESAFPNARLYPIYGQSVASVSLASGLLRAQDAAPLVPTDQYYPLQWAFRALNYPVVWGQLAARADLKPVVVAVLDGGIRYDHPDLRGRLIGPGGGALDLVGFGGTPSDGFGPDEDPTDPSAPVSSNAACTTSRLLNGSHGTHVAGIITATSGPIEKVCDACSPSGVVGATFPAPVKVLPLRVISMRDAADSFTVSSAIRYVAGDPILFGGKTYTNPLTGQTKVINLSLGGALSANSDSAKQLCDAITYAKSRGVLTVAAAGNNYGAAIYYPAACPDAVSVGSVGLKNAQLEFERARYSAVGPSMTLSAPGGDSTKSFNGGTLNGQPFPDSIFSTSWDYLKNQPKYEALEGTSQASPQVAALAALIFSTGLESTPQGALERMERTALELGGPGQDPQYGYGVIQPVAALDPAK